jgi:hypothetical protein
MSTFAPLQFLKSAQNPLVWTAVDNGTDTRTSLIIYYGAVNTLPADTGMYEVNCIMMHQAEKQLYANTGTTTTPSWEAFGPNSALPQPLVPGTFLFTDGATVYWATSLVGQVQYNASNLNQYGILNFNDFLVASNDVPNSRINVDLDVVSLAGDATFISTLEGNLDLANIGGFIDLSTQVTGLLDVSNIDVSSLANDTTFIDALVANTYFTSELANDSNFITELTNNATFIGDLITEINLAGDIAVVADGVTITGTGTTLDPLVAVGGSSSLEIEENGVSVETGVTKINILSNSPIVTNPVAGEVEIDLTNLGGSGGANLLYDAWDDFLSGVEDRDGANFQGEAGMLRWTAQVIGGSSATPYVVQENGQLDHTGIVQVGLSGDEIEMFLGDSSGFPIANSMRDGNSFTAIISPDTLPNTRTIVYEVTPTIGSSTISNNSIRFEFDENTGDMFFRTRDGATTESTNLGAYTLSDWYEIRFEISGSSVLCYLGINSATPTLVATHSTNVPTTNTVSTVRFYTDFAALVNIDFFGMKYGRVLTSPSSGTVINLTAGEDLTAGDTVGYASFIDDTAMKAVWSERLANGTGLSGTVVAIEAICRLQNDVYAIAVNDGTNYECIIGTLDRDTNTWTFGALSGNIDAVNSGNVDVVRLDNNKFAFVHFSQTVNPYTIEVTVCTVSGTTITIGGNDSFSEPSTDNANNVQCVALGTDRFAMVLGGSSATSHCDLFEVTVSGTTPTIGTQEVIDSNTSSFSAIALIGTDKVAVVNETSIWIATVSAGTWTVGSPVTFTGGTGGGIDGTALSTLSLVSNATDTVFLSRGTNSNWRTTYFTISGTVPTIVANGTQDLVSNTVMGIVTTDGTDVYTIIQSSAINGIAKLSVSGTDVLFSTFIPINIQNGISSRLMASNQIIDGSGYFGICQGDNSSVNEIEFNFYVQGMTPYFIGIAQSTVSRGANISVKIGGVDTNQTGLTTGTLYDAFEGGIVATGTQLFNTMQAQNSTDLKI